DPPADWKTATVGGSARLYYVRFRTLSAGTAPVAASVLGRDYAGARGGTSGVIPAFDTTADANHDGYLSDAEYAHRPPGRDARFLYESRLFAGSYGQMRFATDPSAAGFRAWAADFVERALDNNPLAQGVFLDNSAGTLPASPGDVVEPVASFTADFATML